MVSGRAGALLAPGDLSVKVQACDPEVTGRTPARKLAAGEATEQVCASDSLQSANVRFAFMNLGKRMFKKN